VLSLGYAVGRHIQPGHHSEGHCDWFDRPGHLQRNDCKRQSACPDSNKRDRAPGVALSFAATAVSSNPVTYAISGNPAGMTINTSGVVNWASPVLGTYSVTVSAKDTKTGLTGTAVYSVKIANAGPVITAAAINGTVGKALSSSINISDASATSFQISISGVPLGMTFSLSGMNVIASWAKPVAGTYSLKVVVTNNNGLSSQATIPVTIK